MEFSAREIKDYGSKAASQSDKTYKTVAPTHTEDHDTVFEFVPRKEDKKQ